jgi:ankyrin repeat protein
MDAAALGNVSIAQTLLNSGANIHLRDEAGQTALVLASYEGHLEIVKPLFSQAKVEHLVEALIAAAGQGQSRIVQHLIRRGLNPTAVNRYGVSAYYVAMNNKQQEMMQLLARHKNKE